MPDPIKGRPIQPHRPIQPATPEVGKVAPKPETTFDPAATPVKEQAGQVVRENYDVLRGRIQDGIRRGLGKGQILRDLTRQDLSARFGARVSDQMINAVAEAIEGDPNFAQVFDKLFKQATAE